MPPLYIFKFRMIQPHMLIEAEKFNITYTTPEQITSIADKLRWYRYRKGLLQREVADYAGIYRTTYSAYEEIERNYYPPEKMKKIAELLEVDIYDLLDDYNTFVYRGQGQQVRALREKLGLSLREFAKRYNVSKTTVIRWENDRVQIYKSTWKKLFGE